MKKAHEILSKESSWHKGSVAKDRYGLSVEYNDDSAVSFCVLGAICRCYPEDKREEVKSRVCDKLAKMGFSLFRSPNVTIFSWNDNPERTQNEVVDLLRRLDV